MTLNCIQLNCLSKVTAPPSTVEMYKNQSLMDMRDLACWLAFTAMSGLRMQIDVSSIAHK